MKPSVRQPRPEEWRILRALTLYRVLLATLLLVMIETSLSQQLFEALNPDRFRQLTQLYALAALALAVPLAYRRPRLEIQAHAQFTVDVSGIVLLVFSAGGIGSGLAILLITPTLACALVLGPRMAIMHAAAGTLAVFSEELIRQSGVGFNSNEFAEAGVLGLMLFATSIAGSAAAARARKSEALAERAGSEVANLSRLNESIIESMQTGVVVVDSEQRIRTINAAALRLLGIKAALNRQLPREVPGLAAALGAWLDGATSTDAPLPPRPGVPEVIPRFARLGYSPTAPILILLDDAHALREQARQIKLAALGRLSASIAHEIRNPLAAITHAGQLLAESGTLSSDDQRLLAMIQRHGARINKIVRDVLALSRHDGTPAQPLRLREWLHRTVAAYEEAYPHAPRRIELGIWDEELTVRFNPDHLQQVLFNLWDNSFEHAPDPAQAVVSLHAERQERTLTLDIMDNGSGIAPDLMDRIFEPFFTTSGKGNGLGLYLARELCEYNQARLVYVPQTLGACFRLHFPAVP
jgi:two-component system, NtrC family, sensor histidine kinase PilS